MSRRRSSSTSGDSSTKRRICCVEACVAPFPFSDFGFELRQDLAGALDHRPRQTGQLGDVDAVGLVRAARDDLVQEHDPPAFFGHGHVVVAHRRQQLGQPDQLVVVRGEQRRARSRGWLWMNSTTAQAIDSPS